MEIAAGSAKAPLPAAFGGAWEGSAATDDGAVRELELDVATPGREKKLKAAAAAKSTSSAIRMANIHFRALTFAISASIFAY